MRDGAKPTSEMIGEYEESQQAQHERYIADARMKEEHRNSRRDFLSSVLFGVAVLAVVLAIIGAIWNYNIESGKNDVEQTREHTRQEQVCVNVGGTWINGSTCVPNKEAQ